MILVVAGPTPFHNERSISSNDHSTWLRLTAFTFVLSMQIPFLKKIDDLVTRSFIPPFILAFFIAVFVLVMQFLWNFIDEIVGKGLDTIDLFELIFYRSLSLFPLALPISVLLASVMVFGNLSEKYELSSLKSAGVSLLRIMAPAFVLCLGVGGFSLFCSNTLIPLSNLKFQSRLWDIRNQKPSLSLEEIIFNDDFKGYTIRIGKKEKDNRTIRDVMIYDHSNSTRRRFNLVTARSGEMYISEDKKSFVMKLYDGHQYQELESSRNDGKYPFSRSRFRQWEKQFDLGEFELGQTDEDLFKSHHTMKGVRQLRQEIDTIRLQEEVTLTKNFNDFADILDHANTAQDTVNPTTQSLPEEVKKSVKTLGNKTVPKVVKVSKKPPPAIVRFLDTLPAVENHPTFIAMLPAKDFKAYMAKAPASARGMRESAIRLERSIDNIRLKRSQHIFELHWKFSLAAICLIFLFIGGSMGAIVRKGGYGYPLLISIIYFTAFIILNLMCKKLMETGKMEPALAAWLPNLVMLPIAVFITFKAVNDSKMLNVDTYLAPLIKLFSKE